MLKEIIEVCKENPKEFWQDVIGGVFLMVGFYVFTWVVFALTPGM
jgi:hypothetical protein